MRSSNTSTLGTTTPASRNRLGTLASRIAPSSNPPASVARSHAPSASGCKGSIGPALGSCTTSPPSLGPNGPTLLCPGGLCLACFGAGGLPGHRQGRGGQSSA
jgi:hypothetical protein